MLINADVKSLEVIVAAELSRDKTLRKEILDGVDFHEVNRDTFNLGTGKEGRLVAKTLKFRTIYGGSAYSFANDPEMNHVSKDQKFWQGILDAYFQKYWGLANWHKELILEAQKTGRIEVFTGRYFPIVPDYTKREPWPLTICKNYPVQSVGADLVMLARLEARRRIREAGIVCDLVSTIHDSIVADCPKENVEQVGRILFESIAAVPSLCKKCFDYDFSLPMTSEVQYGPNKKEMLDMTF